jgi:hypothetical protein
VILNLIHPDALFFLPLTLRPSRNQETLIHRGNLHQTEEKSRPDPVTAKDLHQHHPDQTRTCHRERPAQYSPDHE